MKMNQADYESLLDCLEVAVLVLSGDLPENPEIIYNNATFAQWVSASPEEILGQSLAFLFSPEDRSDIVQTLKQVCEEDSEKVVNLSFEGLDSQHRCLDFSIKPFKHNAGNVTACILQEVKQSNANAQVDFKNEPGCLEWKLAQKDEDSGVFSRRYLYEQIERECLRLYRYGSVYTLIGVELLIDDDEKQDVAQWDQVFQSASNLLQEAFRSQDVIGRHQPDQFVALMPETKLSQALYVAERLKRDFSDQYAQGKGVRVAIGVTEGKVTDQHFSDTLSRVEASLEDSRESHGIKVSYNL